MFCESFLKSVQGFAWEILSTIVKVGRDKEKGARRVGSDLSRTFSGPKAHLYLQSDPVPQSIKITLIKPPDTWFYSSLCETISLEKLCCWESRSLSWGLAKKVLLGLVMTFVKSEVFVRGHGVCSVLWPRFSPEAAGSLGRRRVMKGLSELLLWVLASVLPSWLVMSSLPIWWEIPDGRRKQGAAKGDASVIYLE